MDSTLEKLRVAQRKAIEWFDSVEDLGLIRPGITEAKLNEEVQEIGRRKFDVEQHWGKKIVRAGSNTMAPYLADPVNRIIQEDDIVFFDFHPVFDGWEADLGRTYVLGKDQQKLKIKQDIEKAWWEANHWYYQQSRLTGSSFFTYIENLTRSYGYEFGNAIAGHIVGRFPHEQPDDPSDPCLDVHPNNHQDILSPDKEGNPRHWILELHFVDPKHQFGAFFEQLLTPQ